MRIPSVITIVLAIVATIGAETPAFAQFTDDPLTAGTPVKAVHITELRTVIANLRSAFGLPVFTFTDPTLTPSATVIRTVHLTELRTAINAVYAAAGKTPPAYTDPSPAGLAIKAAHIQELRTATANAGPNAVPSFTKGASQTVAEDAGAQNVVGWATSISAGAANESGQTLNFVFDTNDNTGLFSAGPAVAANGTLTYTPAANQHGVANITLHIHDNGGTVNGGIDNSATQAFTITVTAVNDPPVVPNRTADAQANIRVSIGGLLTGIIDADNGVNGCTPTFSLAGVSGTTSPAGGLVAITNAASGVVDFDPPPGVTGAVTFTYTVSDTGCPGTATGAAATVTVTVNGPVTWFVDSTAPGGGNGIWTGTNTRAFQTLAQADAVNVANDRVFVINNNASPINYAGGLVMQAGERLIGQGVTGASFDAVVLGLTPPAGTVTRPGINGVRPALQGTTTLANGVTVTGVNFTPNSAVAAMTASALAATAAITIDQVIVSGAGGATSALSLTNVTATGAGALNVSNTSFTNTSAAELLVSGGNIPISLAATISSNAGRSIDIQNRTGGMVTVSGSITDTGTGVFLNANTGSTINFSGGLTLSTTTNPGFTATGGGTVSATQNNTTIVNTITTTTGTALNIASTTIGAGGLTFRSISSNGAANGILLNATGAGSLVVTGNSAGMCGGQVTGNGATVTAPVAADCSGGAILASTGAGVSLTSTGAVSLTRVRIATGGNDGIAGNSVAGLTLTSSVIESNGNAVGERGVDITNLTGTGGIASSTIRGSSESNIVINNTTGVLSSFNVTNSQISTTSIVTGDDGLLLLTDGAGSITASVSQSAFTDNKGDHFQAATTASATGAINVTFSNNTLLTTAANDPNVIGGGITISPSGSADLTFTIAGNNIQQAFDDAINLNLGTASTAAGSMVGTISNNTIGTAGQADSGSESSNTITVTSNGAGTTTVAVTNNVIRQYGNGYGILLDNKEGSSTLNGTVTGNNIDNPGTFALNGIHVNAGATSGPPIDSGLTCAAVTGNSVTNAGLATADIRLRQRFSTTIRLPGYAGAASDTTAVNSFVSGNNGGAEVTSIHNVGGGGFGYVGGAACPVP